MDNKKARVWLWLGLLAVALLGVWLIVEARARAVEERLDDARQSILPQPTPTIYPSAATIIESVQRLSRLETASYHIEKVITAETGQGPLGFLFGDRLLLIAYGEVIAGVDLGDIGPDSVMRNDDGVVYMRMPPVEIFVSTLDNNRTHVYDRRTGVAGMNVDLESAARREAERLVLQAAIEDGIEEEAEESAREFMRSFLTALGFENVIFVDVLPTPTPTPIPTGTPVPPLTL